MTSTGTLVERRHDVDWLRVIALGLLIVYHISISFQPWGVMIFFPQNNQPLTEIWPAMSMINVWRIPILFLVSGMGVSFAMARRNWLELLKERSLRILVPLGFGFLLICPISVIAAQHYFVSDLTYVPNLGHLWFLANIYIYVLVFLPLLYLIKTKPDQAALRGLKAMFRQPWTLFLFAIPLMISAWLSDPEFYTGYAGSMHGFWLGMICFFIGFLFASIGPTFWRAAQGIRFFSLAVALALYIVRTFVDETYATINWLAGFETMCWMLAILGFTSLYLNKPSRALSYLNKAVFPVYILHMPVQHALCNIILRNTLPPSIKFILLIVCTFAICMAIYEFVLRRNKWLGPFFGIKVR
jgi:glucans biosynthesis protein C